MEDKLECPYCGFVDEDWYECSGDSGYYDDWECGNCEKKLCVEIEYRAYFNVSKKNKE